MVLQIFEILVIEYCLSRGRHRSLLHLCDPKSCAVPLIKPRDDKAIVNQRNEQDLWVSFREDALIGVIPYIPYWLWELHLLRLRSIFQCVPQKFAISSPINNTIIFWIVHYWKAGWSSEIAGCSEIIPRTILAGVEAEYKLFARHYNLPLYVVSDKSRVNFLRC